jgi:hypothetical protein
MTSQESSFTLGRGVLACHCRGIRLKSTRSSQGYRQYLVATLVLPQSGGLDGYFCVEAIAVDMDSFWLFTTKNLPRDVLVEATGQMSSLDGQAKPLVRIIFR